MNKAELIEFKNMCKFISTKDMKTYIVDWVNLFVDYYFTFVNWDKIYFDNNRAFKYIFDRLNEVENNGKTWPKAVKKQMRKQLEEISEFDTKIFRRMKLVLRDPMYNRMVWLKNLKLYPNIEIDLKKRIKVETIFYMIHVYGNRFRDMIKRYTDSVFSEREKFVIASIKKVDEVLTQCNDVFLIQK